MVRVRVRGRVRGRVRVSNPDPHPNPSFRENQLNRGRAPLAQPSAPADGEEGAQEDALRPNPTLTQP